jgi:NTE family protein
MLDVRLTGGGLINGRLIAGSLKRLGLDGAIEDCPKPFAAVATDLATGREVWLEKGPIGDAVRASMSLPGIFAPARIGDAWMVDGGLVNPVPVSTCRALGADIIIAVNLNGDLVGRRSISTEKRSRLMQPETVNRLISRLPNDMRDQVSGIAGRLLQSGPSTPSYFDVLANSINIMQDQITRTRLAGEPPHHLVLPRLAGFGLMEFNRAQEAIEEGRAAVRHSLPALRKVLATID